MANKIFKGLALMMIMLGFSTADSELLIIPISCFLMGIALVKLGERSK